MLIIFLLVVVFANTCGVVVINRNHTIIAIKKCSPGSISMISSNVKLLAQRGNTTDCPIQLSGDFYYLKAVASANCTWAMEFDGHPDIESPLNP